MIYCSKKCWGAEGQFILKARKRAQRGVPERIFVFGYMLPSSGLDVTFFFFPLQGGFQGVEKYF